MTVGFDGPDTAARSSDRWRVKRHHAAFVGLMLLVGGILVARWFIAPSEAASKAVANSAPAPVVPAEKMLPAVDEPAEPAVVAPAEPSPVEQRKQKLLGSWRDQYYGERTMTFREDGTGKMIIKLDAIGRLLIGEQLLFNMTWEDRDGVLVMQFTGGEPKDAVARISKDFGDRHEQRIEVLTEADLHLRSTDSNNLYTLKRVAE